MISKVSWRSRVASSLASLTALALIATGCATFEPVDPSQSNSPSASAAPTENKAPNSDGVPDELKPFYEQSVAWQSCGLMECATIVAPLDWEDLATGEIELAVVRQRALGGDPVASLLTNPGGPGASGLNFIADSIDFAVDKDLQTHFDVVGFDPRGVGRSTAVTCFDAAEMDHFLYGIPQNPRGSDAWVQEIETEIKKYADACEQNSGGILPYITTVQSARDLDLLRGVLGDEQLHYLGFSYGTFLGSTYAELFPERAGRLVLDGAVDPSVPGVLVGATQAGGFQASLEAYLADCLTDTSCPFTGTKQDALDAVSTLLASLDNTPLDSLDGRKLGADSMVTAIILALYSADTWLYLTMAFEGVFTGDPAVALFLADAYNSREMNGTYSDNQTDAFNAYNCVDYPVDAQADIDQAEQVVQSTAPTFAPYWGGGPSLCDVWSTPPTGTRAPMTAAGAPPIVVVGTTGDPATPYDWSVKLAEQLDSGVLVTYQGEGHTAYNKGSSCINQLVDAFLIDGVVPANGTICQ